MGIAFGIFFLLFGLGIVFNVRGLAVWGSQDRWHKKDASGKVKQVQPVWMTRIVGVAAAGIGGYMLVHETLL